jgi:hypothetical protein
MNRHLRRAAWLACGLIATALASASNAAEKAAPAPQQSGDAGWVSLFDGSTLSGWEALQLPNQKQPTKWEVVDGMLVGSGGQSMIYSPKGDYKNFKFRAEVKINDKGNSGMYFRAAKVPSFTAGYECQINATHSDPIRSGSIYTMAHLFDASSPTKPDTFFTQEIEVKETNFRGKMVTNIKVKIDNRLVLEVNDFDRLYASGHFAFQQHDPGSKVTIRKIEVMELPDTKK